MIHTLLDACEFILTNLGEPQSSYWLASQAVEMKLWRAGEADVRVALLKHIEQFGENSRFMRVGEDKFALRSWVQSQGLQEYQPLVSRVQLQDCYPTVAKWVRAYGWIEVGQQETVGFVARALDDGGLIFNTDDCSTLNEAIDALETGLREWFGYRPDSCKNTP